MSSDDSLDPDGDPFRPPAIPTLVGCLHCGQEYESFLIEWRVETDPDGQQHGFWCCPVPGCDGRGFGFDILPIDPDYQDERGGWIHDEDEDEDEEDDELDDDVFEDLDEFPETDEEEKSDDGPEDDIPY